MDILEKKLEYVMNGKHEWEQIPFSTHHGWNPPDWRCNKCHQKIEQKEECDLPTEGCLPLELIAKIAVEMKELRSFYIKSMK